MDKLKQKAESLAEAKVQQAKTDVKAALVDELPGQLLVEDTSDGVAVSGPGLRAEMIDNSSLRDVAFLMRGVR